MAASSIDRIERKKAQRKRALELGMILHDVTGQTRTKKQWRQIFANYTEFGRKYGHPRGMINGIDHTTIKYTGKSGLTPLSPGIYSQSLPSPTERRRRRKSDKLREYQGDRLQGFTSEELLRLKSLPSINVTKIKQRLATVPLHPILAQNRWFKEEELPKHQGDVPIWGLISGFWNPILELVTLMLTHSADNEWLDTDFYGRYEVLPKVEGVAPRSRLLPRTPEERILDSQTTNSERRSIQDRLLHIVKHIRFGLDSGNMESDLDMPVRNGGGLGYTRTDWLSGHVEIWIATEALQPLLRKDLTNTEVNAGYRQPPSKPQTKGEPDPYTTIESWPVPTEWYGKIVTQEFWDQKVRSYGLKALQMGHLKYGTRMMKDSSDIGFIRRMENGKIEKVNSLGSKMQLCVPVGQTEAQQEAVIGEEKRSAKGQQILEAMSGLSITESSNGVSSGQGSPEQLATAKREESLGAESDSDPEARDKTVAKYPPLRANGSRFPQKCPRYEEIKAFLTANRGEQKLALDTMALLPEPTFYRYIRDLKSINLTTQEFKAFLSKCHENKELFIWKPFPIPGIVISLEKSQNMYLENASEFNDFKVHNLNNQELVLIKEMAANAPNGFKAI
ncbi:hypothetical protein DL98DRAFT_593452 [Cadophora sp. DSE1049]|nr:hypothetical protein DL98DRAFT_593452 [Cadophora sp. DSE1049]